MLGRFAGALTGTAELFARPGRTPQASVNFVTCHDGFTLADLVSFEHKHNLANGEHNRDGTDDNRSWNCGVEGPTDDPAVRRLRARQQRNLLGVTVLAGGVPMLCAGDEQGRTQAGNNNAYCQDNELSWVDWDRVDVGLRSYVRWLLAFRRDHPVLRQSRWPTGRPDERGVTDIAWYTPDGDVMGEGDWNADYARSVAVLFDGRAVRPPARPADSVYVVCNAHAGRLLYRLPPTAWPSVWRRVLDTSEPLPAERLRRYAPGERVRVEGYSLVILTGLAQSAGAAPGDQPVG
jgi:glycogen operon protein